MPVNRHCLEVRTADAAVNYHLGIGIVLAAGLDGIQRKLDPGAPLNYDMYKATKEQLAAAGDISLPTTLGDALNELEADDLAREVMGDAFHSAYLDYKRREVAEFNSVVTNWEIDRYLQQN
jgi:glutamine synthetase